MYVSKYRYKFHLALISRDGNGDQIFEVLEIKQRAFMWYILSQADLVSPLSEGRLTRLTAS